MGPAPVASSLDEPAGAGLPTIRSTTLTIGARSIVNHGCFFSAGDIRIGRDVGVTFLTGDHEIGPRERRVGPDREASILVEDGCWIGADVTVLSGVTVAHGCIVGAGALLTRSTEPDGVYVGVPARRVRDLD